MDVENAAKYARHTLKCRALAAIRELMENPEFRKELAEEYGLTDGVAMNLIKANWINVRDLIRQL